ncbi:MAG: hypothetical protein ACJAVV_000607 [Alphaproteobacteria bacterium]|jgi:hypothetical protein
MAIINCPKCNKTISDKATSCSHCQYEFGEMSADDIRRKLSAQRYKKLQKIQTQSMLSILLFIVGCYFVFLGDFPAGKNGIMMYNASLGVTIIGFIWYAINRVRITLTKRS